MSTRRREKNIFGINYFEEPLEMVCAYNFQAKLIARYDNRETEKGKFFTIIIKGTDKKIIILLFCFMPSFVFRLGWIVCSFLSDFVAFVLKSQ